MECLGNYSRPPARPRPGRAKNEGTELMTTFEREMLIEDCRAACRDNVLRTDEERAEVWANAEAACERLGISHPEDGILLLLK